MQIKTHIRVSSLAEFLLGTFLAMAAGAALFFTSMGPGPPRNDEAALTAVLTLVSAIMAGGAAGWGLAQIIFRYLVAADCPKCNGPAFRTGSFGSVSFICRECGHAQTTDAYEDSNY